MTSSLALKKRKEMCPIWNFEQPGDSLGGWESHYITPGGTHECHPDYEATPIGNPYGFMICRKRQLPQPKPELQYNNSDENNSNGYHKYQVNLYDPNIKTPVQPYNPYYMKDRRTPYQADLIREDYLDRDFKYNGTGVKAIHTPPGTGDSGEKYYEYGYSYIDRPPYKYDITRLQQPYPVWKAEKEFLYGESETLDKFDQQYNRRRV